MQSEQNKPAAMKIPLLRLPYTDEEIAFVKDGVEEILRSGYLTMASKVRAFEEAFANWVGVKYALGTNSGTSSLEIPLRAIGVEGQTVVCPSNTYMATPIAAVHAGAKVAFTDCTWELQMDPRSLTALLDRIPDVKAVIVVHIAGIISPDIWKIRKECDDRQIALIEDAAHAHGATIDGRMAGTLGLAGSFSFYPTKVLTTAEGGMVTTDSEELYEQGVVLREHGKKDHAFNRHTEFGYNWRFSELHALLGLQQMAKADAILASRRAIAARYDELLKGVPELTPIAVPANVRSSYYKYVCLLEGRIDRDRFKAGMKEQFGVCLTGEVYADPCHSQPVFAKYPGVVANEKCDVFPLTDQVCRRQICLPLYPGLTAEEVEYTVASLRQCLSYC